MLARTLSLLAPALLGAGAAAQEPVWTVQGRGPSQGPYMHLWRPYVVGDADGDGYPDVKVVVSAAYPLGGVWTLSGKDGSTLRIDVQASMRSAAAAGDVDGDGGADYVRARPFFVTAYVDVLRCADDSLVWQVTGSGQDFFGEAVEGDLDLDGDGRPDVLVGAQREGRLGLQGPFRGGIWAYRHDGSLLYHLAGLPDVLDLGLSLARVGDVDGDGCDDFVSGGFDRLAGVGVALLLSGRTGQRLTTGYGDPTGYLGWDVTGCGDLDGDGVPDFAGSTSGSLELGMARAFSGRTGEALLTWTSASALSPYLSGFGSSIAGGADLDLDGVPDLVVGAPSENTPAYPLTSGALHVFSGRDGQRIHRLQGSGPASALGERIDVLPPLPGNPFPLFVTRESLIVPGWGNVGQIHAFRGAPAGVTPYGTACAGRLPAAPRIGVRELHPAVPGQPKLGARVHLSGGEPGGQAILLLGVSRTMFAGLPLPYPLGHVGFPGCLLHTSVEATVPVALGRAGNGAGYGFFDLPVPLAAAGQGVTVHGQWVALGSGSAFPGGVSAALAWEH